MVYSTCKIDLSRYPGPGPYSHGQPGEAPPLPTHGNSDSDYGNCGEDQGTGTTYAVKQVRNKGFTRRPPKISTFRNNDTSGVLYGAACPGSRSRVAEHDTNGTTLTN